MAGQSRAVLSMLEDVEYDPSAPGTPIHGMTERHYQIKFKVLKVYAQHGQQNIARVESSSLSLRA